jgi:hypothetical protein
MIIILGLIIVIAAVIAAVAGVLANDGSAHALTHGFAVLGYHETGSTGTLFLDGIVTGAIGIAGLGLLLAGARRTSRRGSAARRRLRQSRQETAAVSQDRDNLISEREAARASAAGPPANGMPPSDPDPAPDDSRQGRLHLFGRRPAADEPPESLNGQAAPDVPADTSAS